jgi:lipoyl(octanoyl) transferase
MDPAPFAAINPCGYPGLKVTQTRDVGIGDDSETLADGLVCKLADELSR